eukprot:Gregarina_sp_Poly_1__10277@NODE_720_length_6610_cov_190_458811_g542_i0_p3_GENE_NODE_720_length_6610_cov_190_458811_g542_i0NODE_720_length_6610_cov_190_458811_g542_i0_p3_ORF_typecomplete_len201_score16_63Baculo_VP39/PF04501_12/0_097E1_4HB/PF16191_5/0_11Methyltransf_32/PF13679_6/0_2Methyltransf_32/PF13679_6/2_7e03_NODE_720_length_6610_cov_190_458811_g542_i030653667
MFGFHFAIERWVPIFQSQVPVITSSHKVYLIMTNLTIRPSQKNIYFVVAATPCCGRNHVKLLPIVVLHIVAATTFVPCCGHETYLPRTSGYKFCSSIIGAPEFFRNLLMRSVIPKSLTAPAPHLVLTAAAAVAATFGSADPLGELFGIRARLQCEALKNKMESQQALAAAQQENLENTEKDLVFQALLEFCEEHSKPPPQ